MSERISGVDLCREARASLSHRQSSIAETSIGSGVYQDANNSGMQGRYWTPILAISQ